MSPLRSTPSVSLPTQRPRRSGYGVLSLLSLLAGATLGAVTADFRENYEGLAPGAKDPHFPGLKSNHPTAIMEVRAETPGAELFYAGNTRYLHVQSLSGMNPDAPGSSSQFHGGIAGFLPFQSGTPSVVSAGFDFYVGDFHAELLFGMGEPPASRTDDQHYAVLLRVRGELGLGNKPEIVAGPAGTARADFQKATPYRLEVVVNRSGGPIVYESPIGLRELPDSRYDVYLFNHRTRSLQLIFRAMEFQAGGKQLQGFWLGNFRYDATGRAQDIRLNDLAVFENRVVVSGSASVPPGPATALADFESLAPQTNTRSPFWDLPGNVVADTNRIFGPNNTRYFHIDRRGLPIETSGLSGRFRFNDEVPLVSFGFDVVVNRDPVITGYSDGHDDVAINLTGGDTIANADMTIRLHIRGTRSVGNEGNPAEASPQLFAFTAEGGRSWTNGFDWEVPYRLEVVLNQTGNTITYNTPWAENIILPNEHKHVYLFNLQTGENVALAHGRPVPYVFEAGFHVGRTSPNPVRGTMADIFFKTVPGRPIDLSIDNIAFFENVAVVTRPGALPDQAPEIREIALAKGAAWPPFQPEVPDRLTLVFSSVPGSTYGIRESSDGLQFRDMGAVVPANSVGEETSLQLLIDADAPRFFQVFPLQR